ncbi:MAG: class I SAM-dependent methyltransferase [Desulfomonilaceae bacterium]
MISLFDQEAENYDQWFESQRGRRIFEIERDCLKKLVYPRSDWWFEVGVGSGQFATAFGIPFGLDPSFGMLSRARRRGVSAICGVGEELPCRNDTFDGILMVATICFVAQPTRIISECRRALRQNGNLVVGLIPGKSPWGLLYAKKGSEGHALYSKSKFYTCREIIEISEGTGFVFERAASCLLNKPEDEPLAGQAEGVNEAAGFVAMRFRK